MTTPRFEALLARLYVDARFRERFLNDPPAVARAAGLSVDECAALAEIDRLGLELAVVSFARKRARANAARRAFHLAARFKQRVMDLVRRR